MPFSFYIFFPPTVQRSRHAIKIFRLHNRPLRARVTLPGTNSCTSAKISYKIGWLYPAFRPSRSRPLPIVRRRSNFQVSRSDFPSTTLFFSLSAGSRPAIDRILSVLHEPGRVVGSLVLDDRALIRNTRRSRPGIPTVIYRYCSPTRAYGIPSREISPALRFVEIIARARNYGRASFIDSRYSDSLALSPPETRWVIAPRGAKAYAYGGSYPRRFLPSIATGPNFRYCEYTRRRSNSILPRAYSAAVRERERDRRALSRVSQQRAYMRASRFYSRSIERIVGRI